MLYAKNARPRRALIAVHNPLVATATLIALTASCVELTENAIPIPCVVDRRGTRWRHAPRNPSLASVDPWQFSLIALS